MAISAAVMDATPRIENVACHRIVLRHKDAHLVFGHSDDLFFVLWRGNMAVESIARMEAGFAEFAASRTSAIGALTTVTLEARLPEGASKERMAAFGRAASEKAALSALVFEGEGLDAARLSFLVGSLSLVAKQSFPHRNFKSIEAASQWCERSSAGTEHPFPADRLLKEYEVFRGLAAGR